jgi:hypothetical protein
VPGTTIIRPEPGKRFIRIDLMLVNNSGRPLAVAPALSMSLRDSTNQKYTPSLRALAVSGKSAPSGEIAAGERLLGSLGFEINQAASGLIFIYDPGMLSSGKFRVKLGPRSGSYSAPGPFAGETAPLVHQEGDDVSVGNLLVNVARAQFIPGKPHNQPASGNRSLMVDVSIENRGTNPITFSSMLQVSVKDQAGQKYSPNLLATAAGGGTPPDGELSEGERMHGQIGFEVPDYAQGLELVLDGDIRGFGKVYISLTP